MDDDFFPDSPAESIREVVHLVHNHVAKIVQEVTSGIEHVAEHLSGHNDDTCSGVDTAIAGQETHLLRAVGGN